MKKSQLLRWFVALPLLSMMLVRAYAAPYSIEEEWTSYKNVSAGLDIPALLIAPKSKGDYPVALYLHGRWGLSEEVIKQLRDLSERGVVILAPDLYFARAIPALPLFNELEIEADIDAGVDYLLSIAGDKSALQQKRVALIAQDHGGYFATRLATKRADVIGAYVGWYPILQNPQAPKPKHIYGYMEEVDKMQAPTLLMIGGKDRQMRRIHVERVAKRLKSLKRTVSYIEYAGAERCFDWRQQGVSLSDALARTDSLNQAVRFMKSHLGGEKLLVLGNKGWEAL